MKVDWDVKATVFVLEVGTDLNARRWPDDILMSITEAGGLTHSHLYYFLNLSMAHCNATEHRSECTLMIHRRYPKA